jgi:adenosine deaminase
VAAAGVAEDAATQWGNVNALLAESVRAFHSGLVIAACVVARSAVEVAIESALVCLSAYTKGKAWQLEDRLFDENLRANIGFDPVDRTSVRASLSAIRDIGNAAVHRGDISDTLTAHALLLQMPRALASLSSAVASKVADQP